jgi:hypothetical protein
VTLEVTQAGAIPDDHGSMIDLDVAVSVAPRCVAGKVYLYGTVKNNDQVNIDVTIGTPYGSKTIAGVTPGRSGSASFSTKAVSVEAGEADIDLAVGDAGQSVAAPYPALACG